MEKKKKLISYKNVIINCLIIFLITGLTFFYLSKNNIFDDLTDISNIPWYFYFFIVSIVLLYVFLECLVNFNTFKNINKKMKLSSCIGMYFYGFLGSSITPCKVGHFPFLMYFMQKKGNDVDESLNFITQNQIVYAISQIIIYLGMLIFTLLNRFIIVIDNFSFNLFYLPLIGLIISFFQGFLFIILAFCDPFSLVIIKISAFFKFKFKRIETKEKYIEYERKNLIKYKNQIKFLLKHLYKLFPSFVCYILFILINNSFPYFLYLIISRSNFNAFDMFYYFSLYQAISYVGLFFPIPGNAGGAESSFVFIYKNVMNEFLGGTLLLWRIFNYYFLVLISLIFFIAFTIKENYKNNIKYIKNRK